MLSRTLGLLFVLAVAPLAGCKPGTGDGDSGEAPPWEDAGIDELFRLAEWAKDEVVKQSPEPGKWGELYAFEYENDYRMSGCPWFRFIEKGSIRINEDGDVAYTDLKFAFTEGGLADITSHFKVLMTGETESEAFRRSVAELGEFSREPSFYVERARKHVLETEPERVPKGASDLQLADIRFRYFDRPQHVEISFEQVSTIKRTGSRKSSQTFSRKLDQDGNILADERGE